MKKPKERKLRRRKHFAFIRYYRLRHEAYVEWIKSILALIDLPGAGAIGLKALTDLPREKYLQLVELLDFIRKSEYTGQIRELDAPRDSLFWDSNRPFIVSGKVSHDSR
ncbi:MAG: hypothetical protein LBF09_01705 [Odoribacteraceae bacterium]|jgi:hypothetical protein|nr:hypothetical protein [Odoribacteraceae bacterium]